MRFLSVWTTLACGLVALACDASIKSSVSTPVPSSSGGSGSQLPTSSCDSTALLRPRLVRLSATELRDHVRRSLPGVDEALLTSISLQGEHLARLSERAVSSAELGAYQQAAKAVAESYVASSTETAACGQPGLEEACLAALAPTVGRLFRSLPTAEEWRGFEGVYRRLAGTHGGAGAAAAVVAGAMLSPRTLYQTERGQAPLAAGAYALDNREALSLARFALTGRAPDESELASLVALEPAAFKSALGQLAAAWVHTPEFATRALSFVEKRFGLEHLTEVNRLDPAFTEPVKQAMAAEFREHVSSTLLSSSGSFEQLFASERPATFPGLEPIYGAQPTGAGRRRGVLGLPALLASLSSPVGSDPVKRGIMVRVELLCEDMPPPVPDADFGKVMVTEAMQTRERFEALAAMPACQSCHLLINPPGYLFEEFDQLGRYRSEEKGRPINATGTITPFFGREPYAGVEAWDGIVPLADWLSRSADARSCFATHFASYLLAEGVPQGTANCALPSVLARFLVSGRLDELAQDLVQSELFLQRFREAP